MRIGYTARKCAAKNPPQVDTLPGFIGQIPNGAARANGVAAAGLKVVVALQLAKLLHGAAPNTLLIRWGATYTISEHDARYS